MYTPPFSVTDEALNLLAAICAEQPACHRQALPYALDIQQLEQEHAAMGGEGKFRSSPPAPHWIPVLLEALLSWLKGTETHPLIRAAVFHYEMVKIRPFEAGNSMLAAKIQRHILQEFNPILADLPVNIAEEEYKNALAATDATAFVTLSLYAILAALRERKPVPRRGSALSNRSPMEQIKTYVKRHPGSKRPDIQAAFPTISARMLDRHLQSLRSTGDIEYRGSRKTGAYYPGV